MGIKSVEILKGGQTITNKKSQSIRVPENFLEEVKSREGYEEVMQYKTCGSDGTLTKMAKYRPKDSYALQMITMKDLYPGPNWAFCFGWASYTEGVGSFSFCRYDPAWDEIEDPDAEKNLLMRGCAIMCHEIGH